MTVPLYLVDEPLRYVGAAVGLGVRARKVAYRLGCETLRDLAGRTVDRLLAVPGCGPWTVRQIRRVLVRHGLDLAWKEGRVASETRTLLEPPHGGCLMVACAVCGDPVRVTERAELPVYCADHRPRVGLEGRAYEEFLES